MSRTKPTSHEPPQEIARRAVDAYFADVFGRLPTGDGSNVDLSRSCLDVEAAIVGQMHNATEKDLAEARDSKMFHSDAAFLIGVEVGRRLGGVR